MVTSCMLDFMLLLTPWYDTSGIIGEKVTEAVCALEGNLISTISFLQLNMPVA